MKNYKSILTVSVCRIKNIKINTVYKLLELESNHESLTEKELLNIYSDEYDLETNLIPNLIFKAMQNLNVSSDLNDFIKDYLIMKFNNESYETLEHSINEFLNPHGFCVEFNIIPLS